MSIANESTLIAYLKKLIVEMQKNVMQMLYAKECSAFFLSVYLHLIKPILIPILASV